MTETVLNGLLPISLAIFLGWLSGRLGYLKKEQADVFALFVLRFALPMALFLSAAGTPFEKLYNVHYTLCLLLGLMGTYLIALLTGRYLFGHSLKASALQALVCAFPDMAYFGAPVLVAVIGKEGLLAVLVGNLITSMIMLPLTLVLIEGDEEEGHSWQATWHIFTAGMAGAVKNPLVWLPVAGVALSYFHIALPESATISVDLIAKSSGGVSLFALGLMFYGEKISVNADVLTNIAFKNFLQPALMFAGVLLFGLTEPLAHQVILTGAVPTATAASMFALRAKTYRREATSTILIGTLLGIVTEALLIMLLTGKNL